MLASLPLPPPSNNTEISNDWQRVSTAVLGRDVCVWKEAVRPLVLNRLEALLQQRLWASVDGLIEDLKAHGSLIAGEFCC